MTVIPKQLIYMPKFGFVSISKVIFATCLVTIASLVMGLYLVSNSIKPAEAAQAGPLSAAELAKMDHEPYVDPLVLKQRKIVAYIKNERPEIADDIANKLADSVMQISWKYSIPIDIQLAIATRESKFDQYALGHAGELGFFQIMTKPHVDRVMHLLATEEISNKNIYDPYTNSILGASILHSCLLEKHNNMSKALACYNGADSSVQYAQETLAVAKKIRAVI